MKLLVIYGTPAAGKLTVARELAKISKFKVFHNHLTYDAIKSVQDKEDEKFWEEVRKLRLEIIKFAARQNINLIFTTCYAGKPSDRFIKPLLKTCKKNKINVKFVHLYCDRHELLKRVKGESRKQFRKLCSVKGLRENLDEFGHDIEIPYVKSFKIDNTGLSAKKVAEIINKEVL